MGVSAIAKTAETSNNYAKCRPIVGILSEITPEITIPEEFLRIYILVIFTSLSAAEAIFLSTVMDGLVEIDSQKPPGGRKGKCLFSVKCNWIE